MFDTVTAFVNGVFISTDKLKPRFGWKRPRNYKDFSDGYVYMGERIRIQYYQKSRRLMVTFSCPKLLFGSNNYMAYEGDLPMISYLVKKELNAVLGSDVVLPDFMEWECSKIDYCFNFCVHEMDRPKLLKAFLKTVLSRCRKYRYDTSVFFWNKSRKGEVYDKLMEMEQKDEYLCINAQTKNILRVEVGYRSEKIKAKYEGTTKIKDLLKDDKAKETIEGFLKEAKLNCAVLTRKETFGKIAALFSKAKATNLKEFVTYANQQGLVKAKNKYGKSTYYAYTADLKKNGINLIYTSKGLNDNGLVLAVDIEKAKAVENNPARETLMTNPLTEEISKQKSSCNKSFIKVALNFIDTVCIWRTMFTKGIPNKFLCECYDHYG